MTELHAGGKFDQQRPTRSRAACTASACRSSTRCRELTCASGAMAREHYHARPACGEAAAPLSAGRQADGRRGTDGHASCPSDADLHQDRVRLRRRSSIALRELAFLNSGVDIVARSTSAAPKRDETTSLRGRHRGLRRATSTATRRRCRSTPIVTSGIEQRRRSAVEVALQWNDGYHENGALLHQQHPAARRRHPPDRLPRRR